MAADRAIRAGVRAERKRRILTTKAHVGRVLSDHLIRVAPGPNTTIRTGYARGAGRAVLSRSLTQYWGGRW